MCIRDRINVTERTPKALILYADKYLLVDGEANVLEILDEQPEQQYPVVSGITINSVNLGKMIDTEDTFKISVLSDILKEMETKEMCIRDSSRTVKRGDLFFCIAGFAEDGHKYAPDAVRKGAAAVVVMEYQPELKIPQVIVKNDREAMALAACNFFGHPARRMTMVGVTGTNGKTTTTYMLKSIAEHAGYKVGLIGTIVNMIGERELHTERTTPESIDLQRLLKKMADNHCEIVVMEVSSHSLELKRVFGIAFDVGIFTNLTQDHLDFHKTWDNYIPVSYTHLFIQSFCQKIIRVTWKSCRSPYVTSLPLFLQQR